MSYLIHFGIGLIGAVTGAYARGYCIHRRHQFIVGGTLLALEAIVSVQVVG